MTIDMLSPKASAIQGIRTRRRWSGIIQTARMRHEHTITEIAAATGRTEGVIREFISKLDKLEGTHVTSENDARQIGSKANRRRRVIRRKTARNDG